jgi:hypothetical protein
MSDDYKISLIDLNNDTIEFLCNKMKIKIYLEIINFINKDNNYEYFKLLFINFIKEFKIIKDFLYISTNIYINNSFELNLDDDNELSSLITKIEVYNLSIDDDTIKKNINYYKKYNNLEYIIFLIYHDYIINTYQTDTNYYKLPSIINKYILKDVNNYYANDSLYYIYTYIKINEKISKETYLLHMNKIIQCIFLTNYIDIKNTYAITCINIFLYKMYILNENKTLDENKKKEEKAKIILTLLSRLLLQTNTFYLNNYTNFLRIKSPNIATTSPLSDVETTSPLSDVETTSSSSDVETTSSSSDVETTSLSSDVETTSPSSDVPTTYPLPIPSEIYIHEDDILSTQINIKLLQDIEHIPYSNERILVIITNYLKEKYNNEEWNNTTIQKFFKLINEKINIDNISILSQICLIIILILYILYFKTNFNILDDLFLNLQNLKLDLEKLFYKINKKKINDELYIELIINIRHIYDYIIDYKQVNINSKNTLFKYLDIILKILDKIIDDKKGGTTTKPLTNFIDIFKNLLNQITDFNKFIAFKNKLYDYNNCDKIEEINFIDDPTTTKLTLPTMGGSFIIEDIEDKLTLNDPTYLLNYIPMNNCKRNMLMKFIEKELEEI